MTWKYEPPEPPKQPDAPRWFSGAVRGGWQYTQRGSWEIVKVRENGRVIYWRDKKGRTATTRIDPSHPDCPPEPTSKQLKADKVADDIEALLASGDISEYFN